MLGLSGVVGLRDDPQGKCCAMFSRLGLPNREGEGNIVSDGKDRAVKVSSFMEGISGNPVAVGINGNIAAVNGELFNLDELLESRGIKCFKGEGPAEKILRLYECSGLDFISHLEGAFSLVILDGVEAATYLISDLYGLRPLYYCQKGEGILFSTEVKALLVGFDGTPSVDDQGISDFIFFGAPTRKRTFFKDIKLLSPASIITYKDGSVSEESYDSLHFSSKRFSPGCIRNSLERFDAVFEQTMEKTFADDVIYDIPLSGGLDSRLFIATLRESRARTYTIGSEGSYDLELGRCVAEAKGLSNWQFPVRASDFLAWIPDSVYLTDGMFSPVDSPIIHIAKNLPDDSRIVLDGLSTFDGYYMFPELLLPSKPADDRMMTKNIIKVLPGHELDDNLYLCNSIISPDYYHDSFILIRKSIEEIKETGRGRVSNRFDSMDFFDQTNRIQRYNNIGSVLLRAYTEVRQPFLNQQLVEVVHEFDLLCRSKEKIVVGKYLRKRAPDLARITYERTGLKADASLASHAYSYGLRYLKRKILGARWEKQRIAIDYSRLISESEELKSYYLDCILESDFIRSGFFENGKLEEYVKGFFGGEYNRLGFVSRMLTLALWHSYFIR